MINITGLFSNVDELIGQEFEKLELERLQSQTMTSKKLVKITTHETSHDFRRDENENRSEGGSDDEDDQNESKSFKGVEDQIQLMQKRVQ